MAYTGYKELADKFFDKIKDHKFLELPPSTAYAVAYSYIPKACTLYQSCTHNLEDRDRNVDSFGGFNTSLSDTDIEILSNYMVIAWLDSEYICTPTALKARLSPSDFKSLNLPQSLGKAMELRSMLKKENDQLGINRSYGSSRIFDIVSGRKKV